MQVTFYELPKHSEQADNSLIAYLANIVTAQYQKRQYMTVLCKDKAQAEAIDEYIWQQPADLFIAHNLQGEGPAKGSPVEITWLDALNKQAIRNKKLVINMTEQFLEQFASYGHVIDFVPQDEAQKKAARARYTQYKKAGCNMAFVNAN
jgi:DNA polymerase-3 subunit chi